MGNIPDRSNRCKCGQKAVADAKIKQFEAVLDGLGSFRLDDWGYRTMKLYGLSRTDVDRAVGYLQEQGLVIVEPEWNGLRVSSIQEATECPA